MPLATALVALSLALACAVAEQQRCYVCVSADGSLQEVAELFPQQTFPSCRHPPQDTPCPDTHHGCLTEIKGSVVTRTCAKLAVDNCWSVNGVEYCYCKGQLCNIPLLAEADDEDMTEGSGLIMTSTSSTTSTTIVHPSSALSAAEARVPPASTVLYLPLTAYLWRWLSCHL